MGEREGGGDTKELSSGKRQLFSSSFCSRILLSLLIHHFRAIRRLLHRRSVFVCVWVRVSGPFFLSVLTDETVLEL